MHAMAAVSQSSMGASDGSKESIWGKKSEGQ